MTLPTLHAVLFPLPPSSTLSLYSIDGVRCDRGREGACVGKEREQRESSPFGFNNPLINAAKRARRLDDPIACYCVPPSTLSPYPLFMYTGLNIFPREVIYIVNHNKMCSDERHHCVLGCRILRQSRTSIRPLYRRRDQS